jgi:DmsE family decaheme c-type cytochrome
MGRFTRTLGPTAAITAAIGLWIAVMVSVSVSAATRQNGAPAPKAPETVTAATTTQATGFVGEETCLTCHEDQKKGYHGSPHARAANPRTPAAKQGCESCHGPGQAHVDGGGDKTKIKNPATMSLRDANAACQTCHNRSNHDSFAGGKHDARNVGCVTCHSAHAPRSEKALLKTAAIEETCVQCHRKEVNKVHKSSHMPVGAKNGNKMECTTCHNPHGSQNVKMLKEGTSIAEACASCHAEKRGPFLWEHAVGRENCVTCHDPHGSNNERMLVAKLPMLCQRCHIHSRHPATIYDATQVANRSNRIAGRSCVNCHQMIHGSNHPTSGKVFMR